MCLSPCVSFQRADSGSVIGVSPAVMIRSSSQDSEVSTVVGEHHTGIVVGVGGGFPFGKGGCFLLWRLLLVPGQLSPHGEDVTC